MTEHPESARPQAHGDQVHDDQVQDGQGDADQGDGDPRVVVVGPDGMAVAGGQAA